MTEEPNRPVADVIREGEDRLAAIHLLLIRIAEQTSRLVRIDEQIESIRSEMAFIKTMVVSIDATLEEE